MGLTVNTNGKLTDRYFGVRGALKGVVFEKMMNSGFGRAKGQGRARDMVGILQFRSWKTVVYDPTFLHRCLSPEHCFGHVCVLRTRHSVSLGMLLYLPLGSLWCLTLEFAYILPAKAIVNLWLFSTLQDMSAGLKEDRPSVFW